MWRSYVRKRGAAFDGRSVIGIGVAWSNRYDERKRGIMIATDSYTVRAIRHMDDNSLLRLHDEMRLAAGQERLAIERIRAGVCMTRVVEELRKRHISI
jgi:hypothetical protein